MEQPIVISIQNTFYPGDADIKRLMAYISGEGHNKNHEKVFYIGAYGTKKKHAKAAEQMIKIQKYFGKSDKRRIYHMVVSFKDIHDPAVVKRAAKAAAKEIFKEHQVFYAIHTSTKYLHVHFAFNAVSYRNGKKWHKNKSEFLRFREDILSLIENAM